MNPKTTPIGRVLCLAAASLWLSGCGLAPAGNEQGAPITTAGAKKLSGVVHGGQQPVSGARIQLYAVGNTGRGSAATALIGTGAFTQADGSFNITGLWNCNDSATYGSDPLLYLVATGGNPGVGTGGQNNAIAAMAALGRCSTIDGATFISVNEVTTVAATYALAPFMTDYAHVGASAAGMDGLVNAFGSAAALVNTAAGSTPGLGVVAGAVIPSAEINTLANIMAVCVNSDGGAPCTALFSATTPSGGTAPTDTIGAMLQIAHAPARNVASLYNMTSATPPFQPALKSMPSDWTMQVTFTGGGLSGPAAVAIDASGNAWIANGSGAAVTGMTSQGALLTGANGYSAGGQIFGAQGIAVDRTGNVWVANTLLSSVVKLKVVSGAVQSSASFSTAVSGPIGLAVDSQNNVWVANFGDGSVAELDSNGLPLGGSPFNAGGSLQSPFGVAIDAGGNVWVADNSASVLVKFDHNQNLLSGNGFSDQALVAPERLAVDPQGKIWVAGNGDNGASLFNANGTSAVATPFAGGLAMPTAVAIDGAGSAWLTNGVASGGLVSVQGGAASGVLGALNTPADVAIDASGNVWTANSGDDTVSKFIGLAVPVTVPLAGNVGP